MRFALYLWAIFYLYLFDSEGVSHHFLTINTSVLTRGAKKEPFKLSASRTVFKSAASKPKALNFQTEGPL